MSTSPDYLKQLQKEIEQTPEEYRGLLLRIVHSFREGVMLPSQADTFKRNKQKAQMLTETHEALAEIEASELISGDKVLDWLDSWGDENEKPSPVDYRGELLLLRVQCTT